VSAVVDRPQLGESGRRRRRKPTPVVEAVAIEEAEFQAQIVDLARLCGWRIHHTRAARTNRGWRTPITGDPGFPDLVLCRGRRIVFAELKSATGRLSKDQQRWLVSLRACGIDVKVWRPCDMDEVIETLGRAE
jgi:hypothetical protein